MGLDCVTKICSGRLQCDEFLQVYVLSVIVVHYLEALDFRISLPALSASAEWINRSLRPLADQSNFCIRQ